MNMIEPYSGTFSIRYSEVNRFGRMKLSALFQFMQELAADHAAMHSFGFEDLAADNTYWVLSRVYTEIGYFPVHGETINITTWPKGTEKFFALRDFRFYDKNGNEFGKATTSWLILDKNSHKPQRPVKLETLVFPQVPAAFSASADKVELPGEMKNVFERTARFSDLDVNNHVNNTRYIEWLMDAMPDDAHDFRKCSFLVNYNSEIRLGMAVRFASAGASGNTWFLEGTDSGRSVVTARLMFE